MTKSKRALALLTAALVPILLVAVFATRTPRGAAEEKAARASAPATPSAADFAAEFIGVTNQYATEHGVAAHANGAHCVQAAPGRYMCSYLVTKNGASTCHLMQARWTPNLTSTITVTLAGRTARCGTLREAVRTLG
jgi:hypothetical protein